MVRCTFVLFTLLLLCGLSAAPLAHAQTLSLTKTWGGTGYEEGWGVAVDGSGNVYVAGTTGSFGAGNNDVVLLKFNSSGGLVWQKTWGGTSYDYGYGVAVDGSGNIYVTGITASFGPGDYDVVLLKFDSSGSLMWQKTWGGTSSDYGYGVAVDGSGNIYVTGYTNGFGAGNSDFVLLKFDSSGSLVWQKTWGGTGQDNGVGVAADGSGNIYVTGYTLSFGAGNTDAVLLKYDSSGGLVWQRTWGGTDHDYGYSVAVDGSGNNVYVTGRTYSYGAGGEDVVLLKFDSSGGLMWQKTWGGTNSDQGRDVAVDGSGNIYVTGYTYSFGSGAGYADVALLKFDSSGGLMWQEIWGGTRNDFGYGVAVHAGYVYFTGYVSEASRTLSSVSGTVTTPSGTVGTPTYTPGTPTFTLGTPSGILGTPSGSETYAGGEDIFLLRFSNPAILADLEDFTETPTGDVLMVIGDLALNPHGSKPSGVNYQQGRDTTPLGYLRGMLNNTPPDMFDTNAAINATSGRPLSSVPQKLIFSIGGPGINAVTYYYETTSNATDMAPVKFGYNSTYFYWMFTNGTKVPSSEILITSTSVPPGTSDVFLIQILGDADGRLVVLMYGTRYTGTWAAAEYFKFHVYPTISSWTDSYYIVQWTDAASGTSANFVPDSGDTFTILAQGIP